MHHNDVAKRLYLYGVLACVVLSFAPIFKINVNKCLQIEILCLYLFTQNNKKMKKTVFKYRVISTQTWNNNKTQLISEHKSFSAAAKMIKACEKKPDGNKYHIEEI